MVTLAFVFNMLNFRSFEITRYIKDATSGNFVATNQRTFITGYLETASAEFSAMVEGEYGKTFRLYTDDMDCDIRIGDRVTEGENLYDVKGVNDSNDAPGRKREIVLVKPIDQ